MHRYQGRRRNATQSSPKLSTSCIRFTYVLDEMNFRLNDFTAIFSRGNRFERESL
jgi:hypothetical protein